jgi:DNA processing protein
LGAAFSAEVSGAAYASADDAIVRADAAGLSLVVRGGAEYPSPLHELHDPPAVLWSRGDTRMLTPPVVAIVGTRRATSYGLRVAREIGMALARAGACIVSGMALGIDACVHRAALDAGGRTAAVLGTGADVVYPRANTALYREIVERGLVLSELEPGARSDAGSFPRRNRIIAALAQLTIVVEAPVKSGALITSRVALDLGRDVAAIPGPIDSPQCQGSNELLRDGAHVITSVEDALALVGLQAPVRASPELRSTDETAVWEALDVPAASLDELCARTRLPVSSCLAAVTSLEMRGAIECAMTGALRRRR